MRVIRIRDGAKPGFGAALARWFLFFVVPLGNLIAWISALVDYDKRGWHDKAAGTIVIMSSVPETVAGVLFRLHESGHIEVVEGGAAPPATVDTNGQIRAKSGTITHAGKDLGGDLWRWSS